MEVMMKAANDPVEAPHKITTVSLNPGVFSALEAICLKAMSRHADDRYPDAKKFAEDLTRWLEGHPVRAAKTWFRRRLGLIGAAAAVVVAVVGLAVVGFRPRRPEIVPGPLPASAAPQSSGTPVLRPPVMSVFIEAGASSPDSGLRLCVGASEDSRVEKVEGKAALRPSRTEGQAGFLRFDVDDRWALTVPTAELEI